MSRCDDEPATPELLTEAVAHATEFLFDACPGVATRITRGKNGEHGAIFIIHEAKDVQLFMELYAELFELTDERVEVVRAAGAAPAAGAPAAGEGDGDVAYNVPPDYESN